MYKDVSVIREIMYKKIPELGFFFFRPFYLLSFVLVSHSILFEIFFFEQEKRNTIFF
jgi:hypothetical protein